jgi:hypothetical protein
MAANIHAIPTDINSIEMLMSRSLSRDSTRVAASDPYATLGPTAVVGNSFAIVPRHLSPVAARYVTLVTPTDRAENALNAALSPWVRGGPSREIDRLAAKLTGELRAVSVGLTGPGWPVSSAPARASVVAANRRLIARLAQVPALPLSKRRGWARLTERVQPENRALRNILKAPDITPY